MNLLVVGLACLFSFAPVTPGLAPDAPVACDQHGADQDGIRDTDALIEQLEVQGLVLREIDPSTSVSSCTFNPCENQSCSACVPCGDWQDTGETTCQLAGSSYEFVCTTGTVHKRSCPCCGSASCDTKTGTYVSCM